MGDSLVKLSSSSSSFVPKDDFDVDLDLRGDSLCGGCLLSLFNGVSLVSLTFSPFVDEGPGFSANSPSFTS